MSTGAAGRAHVQGVRESGAAVKPHARAVLARRPSAAIVAAEVERVEAYARSVLSENTKKAYAHDLLQFGRWCERRGMPRFHEGDEVDGVLSVYLASMADAKKAPATIDRALRGILHGNRMQAGPLCRAVLRGIRRRSTHVSRQKTALTAADMRLLLEHCGEGNIAIRNRAILLLGFAGGFRRSELAALDVADVTFTGEGMRVLVRRGKTDQEGRGLEKGIPRALGGACPVVALRSYVEPRPKSITTPALFLAMNRWGHWYPRRLTPAQVGRIVQNACRSAGMSYAEYGGHSLRAGFVTSAAVLHKSLESIMRMTGHRSMSQVLKYVRHATIFEENAGDGLLDG